MMNRMHILLVIGLFIFLTGCGASGKQFDPARVKDIQNNSTTKDMIVEWFGQPYTTGKAGENESWTYQYDSFNAFGPEKSRDLVILFDNNGTVKAYRYSSNID